MGKRMTPLEPKKCEICGTVFQPKRKDHICCSDECRHERNNKMTGLRVKQWKERVKAREREQVVIDNHKRITDIAIEARKHGMTYGQYVAKMGV